jgi:D-glycero-alpha-D-manno-heptose-7-phosphate kinase
MRWVLERGEIDTVGELLDEGWQKKKSLAPSITNDFIDECYGLARSKGALGGKITGAGGGGFLLFYCPRRRQDGVRAALAGRGLTPMDFRFDDNGSQVLLNGLKVDVGSLRTASHDGTYRLEPELALAAARR